MCDFAHPKCGFQNPVFMIFITYSDNVAWLEFYKFFHAHYIYMYILPDNGIIFIFALTRNIKNHAQDIHNNRNMFKTN